MSSRVRTLNSSSAPVCSASCNIVTSSSTSEAARLSVEQHL
ncbi:hypothetical protein [Streptomyces longwoodensis]